MFADAGVDCTRSDHSPRRSGAIGCIVVRPDGSRYVARVEPDPLAQPE